MTEQSRITASIESPPEGVAGTVSVSSITELHPCRQTKKINGTANPLKRILSADISTEHLKVRVSCSTARSIVAESNVTDKSLVRVRLSTKISVVTAVAGSQRADYYVEFNSNCIEAAVNLYWASSNRKRWVFEATRYELGQPESVLEHKLKPLESLLENCGKSSTSYLIDRRISQIEITTTAALVSISHMRYTHAQFLEQLQPFENSLHAFLQDRLKGSATKISLNIVVQEFVK